MKNGNLFNNSLTVRIVLIFNSWKNKALGKYRKRYNSDDVLVRVRSFEMKCSQEEVNYLTVPALTVTKKLCRQRRASRSPDAECSMNSIYTYFHGCRGNMLRLPCQVEQLESMHYKSEDKFISSSSAHSSSHSSAHSSAHSLAHSSSDTMIPKKQGQPTAN